MYFVGRIQRSCALPRRPRLKLLAPGTKVVARREEDDAVHVARRGREAALDVEAPRRRARDDRGDARVEGVGRDVLERNGRYMLPIKPTLREVKGLLQTCLIRSRMGISLRDRAPS